MSEEAGADRSHRRLALVGTMLVSTAILGGTLVVGSAVLAARRSWPPRNHPRATERNGAHVLAALPEVDRALDLGANGFHTKPQRVTDYVAFFPSLVA